MRTALGLVFASSLSLLAGPQASADSLRSGRESPLAETSHTVDVSVTGGVATYRVRRVIANRGKADDEAVLEIDLPWGAAATGLRTRTGKTWQDAELIDGEGEEERYHAGAGGGRAGATTLLSWANDNQLGLRVFPVPARGSVTVEYTLTVPTRYRRGRVVLAYPMRVEGGEEEAQLVDPVLTVRRGGDVTSATSRVNGRRIATGAPIALRDDAWDDEATGDHDDDEPDDLDRDVARGKPSHEFEDLSSGAAELALSPPPIDTVAARLGRVVVSPTQAFGRLELDVAPVLRPLPKRAQVVFVLDASRSTRVDAGLEGQLQLVTAYVSHVPDAEVELVLYRRAATRLFGTFIPARALKARLSVARAAGKLALGNGSALDEGARLAAATIAARTGPRRIVMVSDTMLRGRWDNAAAIAALAVAPTDTVVHLVTTDGSGGDVPGLARDDDHRLAPIVAGRHGILARYGAWEPDLARLAGVALRLVRPVQLDHVALEGLDSESVEPVPPILREGSGLRLTMMDADAPARVRLRAMLWGDPFEAEVTADDARFSTATAAWVAASAYVQMSEEEDDPGLLSAAEVRAAAMLGRAVSPVTSYLVAARAVPPDLEGGVGSGYGVCGCHGRMRGRSAAIPARAPRVAPDPMALVATAARACTAKHAPPPGWKVSLTMESTYDEVVDVIVDGGGDLAIASCLVEAVWAARLTPAFDLPRERFTLAFE